MKPSSPALVTAEATRRLPRWVLLLLGLLYVAPGLIGRDAWKPIDGTSLGLMLELTTGHADWLAPTLLGQAAGEAAWLPYWLGAIFIQLLPGLDPVMASRVPLAIALTLTLVATWQAAFSLALQPWAQPVRFAFGGHAQPIDYARAIGDTALLVLVACLGLAIMGHESSPHPYAMAASAVLLQLAADAQRTARSLPRWRLAIRWVLACLALMASGYPGTAAMLGALALLPRLPAACGPVDAEGNRQSADAHGRWRMLGLLLLIAATASIPWPHDPLNDRPWGSVHLSNGLRTLAWYAWPAWPLAAIGAWQWRHHWRSPHIAFPSAFVLLLLGVAFSAQSPQRHMLLLLPALAPLAALGVPTIGRGTQALIDWLALLMFSVTGLVIGLYGLAMATGWPDAAARAAQRLLPGLNTDISGLQLAFAAAITAVWFWAVRWRTTRAHGAALWKGLVLSAAGTTWCWALLMSLWLPALNHGMSYDRLAQEIATHRPTKGCLGALGLPTALQSALLRQGVRAQVDAVQAWECPVLVVGQGATPSARLTTPWQATELLWQVDQRAEPVWLYTRDKPSPSDH